MTGSCHRLQLDADHALLVDCGLFQGEEAGGASDLESADLDEVLAYAAWRVIIHPLLDQEGWFDDSDTQVKISC